MSAMKHALKIVHTADLHLGTRIHGMSYEKQAERLNDFFKNLREIVEFTIKNKCDFLIIAGDLFSSPLPRGEIFNRFSSLMGELMKRKVQVVAVAGNHDTPSNLTQRNTTLSLQLAGVRNFRYVDYRSKIKPLVLEGWYSKRKVAFYTIPFIYPAAFPGLSISEYEKKIYGLFDKQIVEDREIDYRIGVAHLTVEGARYSEIVEPSFTYELKVRRTLIEQMIRVGDIDYFALGHIHLHQDLNEKLSYPGSIEKIDFGEIGDEKGFILLREDGGRLEKEFIPLKCRKMRKIEGDFLDLTKPWNTFEKLREKLSSMKLDVGDSMVKLEVKYRPEKIHEINWRKISSILYNKGAFYVKVERIAERSPKPRLRGVRRKGLEELVEEYIRNLPELRKDEKMLGRVLNWAKRIIQGEF